MTDGTRDYIFTEGEHIQHHTHCSECDYPLETTSHSDFGDGTICDICVFDTYQDFVESHPENKCDDTYEQKGWDRYDCEIIYSGYKRIYDELLDQVSG